VAYLNEPRTLRDEISPDIEVLCLNRKGKFDFAALRQLIVYVANSGIDTICCVNPYPLLYGFLAGFFLKNKHIRIVATTNETNFVHRKDELKMVLYTPLYRRVDAVIFGSAYQQDLWISKYRLNPSKCTYIHNGVDTELFRQSNSHSASRAIRQQNGIPVNSLVIGSIGRFRKEKQYQVVIHACVALREKHGLDVHCLLVGGGFEEQLLRDLVTELDCESYVHLIDSEEDVRPYLEAIDIFVLSSISETFSNAALEAMAMGLPVVLPGVGGCPEMVEHGITGFIYETGDLSGFVDYLKLLGTDKERRVRMSQAARKYVETNFRFESMVDSYAALFSSEA
jgi:glycosyltransferase involved in cell wall biosynthesis